MIFVIFIFLLLVISSFEVGVISAIRKIYQVKNGSGEVATEVSFLVSMAIMAICSFFIPHRIEYSMAMLYLSLFYAFISVVTAILCLVGSAWGNLSIIIICATLGTLIIPSLYGLIMMPEENQLTLFKIIGFICAFLIFFLNFISEKKSTNKTKNSFKYKLVCIVVFFTNGSGLIIFNIVNKRAIDNFQFVTFYAVISSLMMMVLLFLQLIKNRKKTVAKIKSVSTLKNLALMVGYAVFGVTSELIGLYCAGKIPLIFQAPVSFSIPIITIAILDYFMYKVKFTRNQIIQIILAVICCGMFLFG